MASSNFFAHAEIKKKKFKTEATNQPDTCQTLGAGAMPGALYKRWVLGGQASLPTRKPSEGSYERAGSSL
jgi:hypothetical protein